MSDLPPPWKSFYDRALDYINDRDLEEARWSAERSLYYLEKLVKPDAQAKILVLRALQEIATLRGNQRAADDYASQVRLLERQKSLWQHLRED